MDCIPSNGRSVTTPGERIKMAGHHTQNGSDAGAGTPSLPRAAQAQIGRRLRAAMDCAVETDMPDEMARLLSALEARLAGG